MDENRMKSRDSVEQAGKNNASVSVRPEGGADTPEEMRGKYQFLCRIGQGSQGNVFKAIRLADGKHVAIKILDIGSVQNWKAYELFQREAATLSSLKLKGVAEFYEAPEFLDQKHPRAFIVQEYIEGRSLNEMIKSGYRFTINRVFEIALELIDLLEQLHKHDPVIIHRDLKPANIMCRRSKDNDYDVYLIDFGAVSNPKVQGGGSTIAGTCGYMPPEQLMGRPECASDIYALGATLVYMLSGVDPGSMQVKDFHLIIEPHLEQMPVVVVNLLRQMLEPVVGNRLCDYDKLREAFKQFANNHFEYVSDALPSAADLEARLAKVTRYSEPGAIDLWAALDDRTPRTPPFNPIALKQTDFLSREPLKQSKQKKRGNKFGVILIILAGIFLLFSWNTYRSVSKEYDRGVNRCHAQFDDILKTGKHTEMEASFTVPCDSKCALEEYNRCLAQSNHKCSFSYYFYKVHKCNTEKVHYENADDGDRCFNYFVPLAEIESLSSCMRYREAKKNSNLKASYQWIKTEECEDNLAFYIDHFLPRGTFDKVEDSKQCLEKVREERQEECKPEYEEILSSGKRKRYYGYVEKECDKTCARNVRSKCLKEETNGLVKNAYIRNNNGFVYTIVLAILGISLGCAGAGIALSARRRKKEIKRIPFGNGNATIINDLLCYGRKSVAIITKVEYLSSSLDMIESYSSSENAWIEGTGNFETANTEWFYHGLPCFKVRYKFNPVDDASSDDLVHEVIIHDEPGEALQPGNPLPILYYIDPADKASVSSMPYPFPQDSIVKLEDIYCHSYQK